MTKRAEGFWWVRHEGRYDVVRVGRPRADTGGRRKPALFCDVETIESLERKIADAFDAYVPKFAVPIPGAEQRMDEQLGKSLERQRSSLLAHGQQLHSESEPALVWDEERRAYREMTPDEVVLYSERCRYPLK